MKLQAEVGGTTHDIEFANTDGKVVATVDGRLYEMEMSEPEPNVILLKHEGRIHEVFVSPRVGDRPYSVRIGNAAVEAAIIDPKRLRGSASGDDSVHGRAEIKTAMPGKVVRLLVAEGDTVATGDGVIVVEAMKMQNEMRSPKDGTVTKIRAAEGDNVSAGDVLVVID